MWDEIREKQPAFPSIGPYGRDKTVALPVNGYGGCVKCKAVMFDGQQEFFPVLVLGKLAKVAFKPGDSRAKVPEARMKHLPLVDRALFNAGIQVVCRL